MITNEEYVPLHAHGDTSFLDGRARHSEMVDRAVENGHSAIALTDHDECNGQVDMARLCNEAGIKFIPGAEQRWLFEDTATSREKATGGYDNSHIILLAADNEGLRNLWTLSSLAYEPANFYRYPQLNPELMRIYSTGLFASDGCGLTRFTDYVEADQFDLAEREWAVLLEIFGDRFYSELHTFQFIDTDTRPLTAKEKGINERIRKMNHAKIAFASEMGVPLVVVNDSHYAWERDWQQHRLVWKMNVKNKKDQVETDDDYPAHAADWMMNTSEIVYWMGEHGVSAAITEEAIRNTSVIADACHAEIKPTISMPRLHATDAEDAAAFATSIEEGFKRFVTDKGKPADVYRARVEREASLIVDKGMAGYFNVVSDYVMRARDGSYIKYLPGKGGSAPTPCLCGPGRGSGGGSLVNYLLGITSLDPIALDLSFERFINPDRPDFPDIDVDFQKSHVKGLIGYMGARYGEDKVVRIGTKSRSGPAKTLQDLCVAMKIDFTDSIKMSKLIKKVDFTDTHDYEIEPDYEPPSWAEVIETIGGDLAPWVDAYPELFERVQQMVGLCRQPGVHAAGIVVSTEPILGNLPTRRKGGKPENPLTSQFDMEEVAWMGGVKDDFLVSKGLDVMSQARELIWARHGKWIDYDGYGYGTPAGCEPQNILTFDEDKFADPAIWEQIDQGRTAGIFQINTAAGTKQAMKFKPRNLQDLGDLVSINRPGVLRVPGLLKLYMRRRHGLEPIEYDHPLLAQITGRTMGILVYQEDLVECAKVLAGFTPGEGETLRKGIGKKKMDIINAFEPKFLNGCMANPAFTEAHEGTLRIAEKIWSSLKAAGAYAFNKAHAAGYAWQACAEIWVKHYYFEEFITPCLAVHTTKTSDFIRECRRLKRPILPPDVNKSAERFSLTDDGIRYGLVDIKGIGDAAMPDIIANRPFIDFPDYLDRTAKDAGRKKGVVDELVKIGAFDFTGLGRQDMLEQIYRHRRMSQAPKLWAKSTYEEREADIATKRAAKAVDYPVFDFDDPKVVSAIEEELVGTFITVDPMAPYINMIENVCIRHPLEMEDYETGERFVIGGTVSRIKTHMQRDQRQMAFITVRWAGEDFEFLAFADPWKANRTLIKEGAPVACEVIKLSGDSANLSTTIRLDML